MPVRNLLGCGASDIKQTYGVPVEMIQRGIANGVRKVNIDTDIRRR
jgi:fructose/tagatose bisphosphate aldolase